ncbi:MAG: molybdate transporter permease subunit [Pseudomonadota bacterium]|jgi:molybdate transport system permease protein
MSPFETAALLLSLQVALATLLVATPLALTLAILMARTQWRGKVLVDALILLPIGLPPAVIGFALLAGLGRDGALGQWLHDATGFSLTFFPAGAVLAASCMTVPLMVRVLRPAFEATDPMLLPVARSLGASRMRAFFTITLPLAWPAVASAMALGLAAAWGESGATLVLAATLQPHQTADITAPVAMVQSLLSGSKGETSAWRLAAVSLGVALAAVLASEWGRLHWRRHWHARLKPVGAP